MKLLFAMLALLVLTRAEASEDDDAQENSVWVPWGGRDSPLRIRDTARVKISIPPVRNGMQQNFFLISSPLDEPDVMDGNRLEDAARSKFIDGLFCSEIETIDWPSASSGGTRIGSTAEAVCARKCAMVPTGEGAFELTVGPDGPVRKFKLAAEPACNDQRLYRDESRACDCEAINAALIKQSGFGELGVVGPRRIVAAGVRGQLRGWDAFEWRISAWAPVRATRDGDGGMTVETYLPASSVGCTVDWVQTAGPNVVAGGTAAIELAEIGPGAGIALGILLTLLALAALVAVLLWKFMPRDKIPRWFPVEIKPSDP